jgi:hypothetical protein
MAEANVSTTKKCGKCQTYFPLTGFNRNSAKKDGLSTECKSCVKLACKRYYRENKEKVNAQNRAWALANREKKAASDKMWRLANQEKCNARNQAARDADPERNRAYQKKNWYKYYEKNLERKRVYRKETPELQLVYVRNRQTRQKNAMPKWADLDAIKAIYRQSAWATRVSGIKHHVDHFYPLKSDVVCGLHNQFNLRIVPAKINLSKGNKFIEQEHEKCIPK